MLETKPIPEPVQHAPEPAAINMPIIMSSSVPIGFRIMHYQTYY